VVVLSVAHGGGDPGFLLLVFLSRVPVLQHRALFRFVAIGWTSLLREQTQAAA